MTLEDAKKKIKEKAEAEWEEFKKTGSMLCQGFALGADDALETLDKVESSGNPEQLTLKELAHEMRKIFRFKYLTACNKITGNSPIGLDLFTGDKPWFSSDGYWVDNYVVAGGSLVIPVALLSMDLDLSEYADENGEIDFSRCIVEVEE